MFKELRRRREGVHMAHVYYGDPCEEFSIKLIETLVENGADMIEFGIPFSDPIADGPTFQAACERALNAGVTPAKCIKGIKKLRNKGLKAPMVLTTYFNIPYSMGLEKFAEAAESARVQAILIPDLPLEEAVPLMEVFWKNGLKLILQVAPTTSQKRLERILAKASGFIYLIGIEGVTGAKMKRLDDTGKLINYIKAKTTTPIMVGFGISRREQAEMMVLSGADGVVVGSAYARIYSQNLGDPFQKLPEIAQLATEIKTGCVKGMQKGTVQKW